MQSKPCTSLRPWRYGTLGLSLPVFHYGLEPRCMFSHLDVKKADKVDSTIRYRRREVRFFLSLFSRATLHSLQTEHRWVLGIHGDCVPVALMWSHEHPSLGGGIKQTGFFQLSPVCNLRGCYSIFSLISLCPCACEFSPPASSTLHLEVAASLRAAIEPACFQVKPRQRWRRSSDTRAWASPPYRSRAAPAALFLPPLAGRPLTAVAGGYSGRMTGLRLGKNYMLEDV